MSFHINIFFCTKKQNIYITYLFKIINLSFDTNQFPTSWKIAKIMPIHKSGNMKLVENYRPISILCNLSKIIERIAHNQISHFISQNSLLSNRQHGFRKHFSTLTAITTLQNKILLSTDNQKVCCVLFFDLSKAFDTIDHNLLLYKLRSYYNFSKNSCLWVKSYLSHRYQYVEINGIESSFEASDTGLPQGSILGPLLFILYINDIVEYFIECNFNFEIDILLYADDTIILIIANTLQELETLACTIVEKFTLYCQKNKLKVNATKTKSMIFSNISDLNMIRFPQNTDIELVSSFKYLGFIVDNKLNFNEHANFVLRKLNSCSSILQRCRNFLPPYELKLLFYAMGLSYINYCGIILGTGQKKVLLKLKNKFIQCGSIIHNCYASNILSTSWDDFSQLLFKYACLFTYRVAISHITLTDCLVKKEVSYNLRSANNFVKIHYKKSATARTFKVWGTNLWNHFPNNMKICDSETKFKKCFNIYLLDTTSSLYSYYIHYFKF